MRLDGAGFEAEADALRERVVQDFLTPADVLHALAAVDRVECGILTRRLHRDVVCPDPDLVAGLGDDGAAVDAEDGVRDHVQIGVVMDDAPAGAAPDGIAFGQRGLLAHLAAGPMEMQRVAAADVAAVIVEKDRLVGAAQLEEFGVLHLDVAVVHEHDVPALLDGNGLAVRELGIGIRLGAYDDVAREVGDRDLELDPGEIRRRVVIMFQRTVDPHFDQAVGRRADAGDGDDLVLEAVGPEELGAGDHELVSHLPPVSGLEVEDSVALHRIDHGANVILLVLPDNADGTMGDDALRDLSRIILGQMDGAVVAVDHDLGGNAFLDRIVVHTDRQYGFRPSQERVQY